MLTFNATLVLPLMVRTCLQRMEASAHWPITILAPNQQMWTLAFSSAPHLLLNPWTLNSAIPPAFISESHHENSTVLAAIGSDAELRFVLALRPQRIARRLFVLQLAPLPSKADVLRRSGFAGCVAFLQMHHQHNDCPPCVENDARTEFRVAGYSWPPMVDTLGFKYQPGDLIPVENLAGINVEIHKVMGQKLKLKFVYLMTPVYDQCENKTTETNLQLMNGTFDAVNLPLWVKFTPDGNSLENASFSDYYMMSRMAWAVPRAKQKSAVQNLFLPLQKSAWLAALAVLLLAWLVGRFCGVPASRSFLDAVSTVLGAASGAAHRRHPVPRFAVVGLRLACLVLTAVYQTKLASILTVPVYENELLTPRDVLEAEKVVLQKMCLNKMPLLNEREPLFAQVERRSRLVADVEAALGEVALGGAAVLTSQLVLEHWVQRSPRLRETVRVHSEVVSVSPVGLFVSNGDPALPRINKLLSRFKAAGLIHKWERDAAAARPRSRPNPTASAIKITLAHLAGAFALWTAALAAALAVFCFERFCTCN